MEKSTYTAERSCNNRRCKKERQTPLQLIAFVVHGDEVDTAYSRISTVIARCRGLRGCLPGNKPASKNPSRTRIAIRPSKLFTSPIPTVAIPQSIIISESHVDGLIFFSTRFEGTSNKMYGMKKMNNAML